MDSERERESGVFVRGVWRLMCERVATVRESGV